MTTYGTTQPMQPAGYMQMDPTAPQPVATLPPPPTATPAPTTNYTYSTTPDATGMTVQSGSTTATNPYDSWPTIPGQPGRLDPATGQCYMNGQKADAAMCGGNIPIPDTGPGPNPGDGPLPPPPGSPGGIPITGTPGTTPPPAGGMPAVDPYNVPPSPLQQATGVGGVSAVNPNASPFDYGQVSDFSDAAWNQAKRYLDPQFERQDRRHAQEMINKGLDPNSEAAEGAFQRKAMSQNDLLSKSAFDALGFGTGLQNQMFGQSATKSGLSNNLLQAMMGLNQRGHEFDVTAGLNANQQAFAQMLGLEGLDYRDYMTAIDQMRYDDSLSLALLGIGAPPGYQTVQTGYSQAPYGDLVNQTNLWNTPLFGSS